MSPRRIVILGYLYILAQALTPHAAANAAPLESCPDRPVTLADIQAMFPGAVAEELPRVFEPEGPPQSVVLVLHGLNLRPSRMDAIAGELARGGSRVLRGGFSGHMGEPTRMREATRSRWLQEVRMQFCGVLALGQAAKAPLSFVGYSMGGAFFVDLLTHMSQARETTASMLLLAPALSLPRISFLAPLGMPFWWMPLPSFAPRQYRSASTTSIAAYLALVASVDAWLSAAPVVLPVPTTILIDPGDELVPARGLASLDVQSRFLKLSSPEFSKGRDGTFSDPRHLIIDPDSLSPESWDKLKTKLRTSIAQKGLSGLYTG